MFALLLLTACAGHRPTITSVDTPLVDVAIVPGCPTEEDGRLSECLWRRTTWAARLYELGITERFIVSGSAAANPYVEAEAIAAGLVALGVPEEAITLEVQALHTDENMGYSLAIAQERGWDRLGVASDAGHTRGSCAMLKGWGVPTCAALPVDVPWALARLAEGLPEVRVEPVERWMSVKDKERVLAALRGERPRPPSWLYYAGKALGLGERVPPVAPTAEEWALVGGR